MAWKLFGVSASIHESVVEIALGSQRIIITDLVAKIDALQAENRDLRDTVNQAFSDLREMRNAPRPTPVPVVDEAKPSTIHSARRPSYANSSIAGGHFRRKPAQEESA